MIVFQHQRELKNPWVPLLPGGFHSYQAPGEIPPPPNIILATPLHISDQGSFLNNSNYSRITKKKVSQLFHEFPGVSDKNNYHFRIQQNISNILDKTFWN